MHLEGRLAVSLRRLVDNTGVGISVQGQEKSGRLDDRAYP